MSERRIAVMGAGGVGGYFGARLAAAGRDVTFIARGAHYEAIKAKGLRVESPLGDLHLEPTQVERDATTVGPVDVVLFAVKLADTEQAVAQVEPLLASGGTLFTFQNGVESADRIASVLGAARVVPGVAYIAAAIGAPGLVRHTGKAARLILGEADGSGSPRCDAFHADCKAAGIAAETTSNIHLAVWNKFVRLAPLAAVTALSRAPIGPLRENAQTRALLLEAAREAVAVARAEGIALPPDAHDRVVAWFDGLPADMTSSMAHDLAAGKALELPWLSGAIVRLGAKHGVPTPVHGFVVQALALHQDGSQDVT